MKHKRNVAAYLALLLASSAGTVAVAPTSGAQSTSSAIMTVGREGVTVWVRNFNPFSPNADQGTTTAIYEPLVVYTPTNGVYHPWLAKSWSWGPRSTSLTFTLRRGVKWSDGQPFTASDVAYTFKILKDYFAGGGFPYVTSVVATSPDTVKFSFNRPFSPALGEVGQQVIVPEHIWSKISNPAKFTNPDPIGTGPFNQIMNFSPQSYTLGRNPDYWQPGKPYFAGLRWPAFPGGNSVDAATIAGQVDWNDGYIPNVQKTFVDKNPKHYYYWFAKTGGTVPIVLNMTVAPFNDVRVRKAISMAINREANVEAVYGSYTAIGNSTGLSPTSNFFDPAIAKSNDWTSQNIAKANSILTAAGYKMGPNGVRLTPSGQPMSYTIETGSTSPDYIESSENVAADVKKIGIDITVTPKSWNTVISDVELGHFQMAHMFEELGTTPYTFYNFYMNCANVTPIGKPATADWGRFCDPKASKLLANFAAASSPAAQQKAADALEAEFAADAPVIPLFTQPDWGEFNTTRFTGFPSASNPYATGQSRYPGAVIVMTTVKPVG